MSVNSAAVQEIAMMSQTRKSPAMTLLKVAVTIGLAGAIIYKLDLPRFWQLITGTDIVFVTLAVAITILSVILSAYKWQLLVKAQGFSIRLGKLISSYFVGLFFNNFMPTSIGGDMVRIMDLRREVGSGTVAAASVVAERVLASVTLGLLVVLAAVFDISTIHDHGLLIAVFTAACLIMFAAILCADRLSLYLGKYASPLAVRFKNFAESIGVSLKDRRAMAKVMLYSIIFQVLVVLINVAIIKALGLEVKMGMIFLFVPIIFAFTMLPISINGLGVREAAYAYFFGRAGLSAEEAIAVSVLFFLVVTLVSLTGGVIFAVRK